MFMDLSSPWWPHQRSALRCSLKGHACNLEGKGQQRVWDQHLMVKRPSNSLRSAWTLYLESHTRQGQRHLGLSVVERVQAVPGTVGLWEKQSWTKEGLVLTLLWLLLCAAMNPENSAWGSRPCLLSTAGSCFVRELQQPAAVRRDSVFLFMAGWT